ncbi:pyroglutamyl-peptidase I [Brachybacterium sp. EF45031]|uniref:pyroglutamyl-peptidase I n=1 Tax=Brachybacterium sillae TaxID=2810536 RepID=UPI00217E96AB|nr:pyroglutamyl-peptidase I [Brachybacterium sillae]MCS6711780.1 pyroglutamyl-peptidase I [Brachybacterium sillae]
MALDVLLTGFEPFDGHSTNASWEAVRHAADALRERGITVQAHELPVVFGAAGEQLVALVDALRPQLVVATGVAGGRAEVTPERVAVNLRDARIPDNVGASPIDVPCVAGAPTAYFTSLPVKAMTQAAREVGVPASVSLSAGSYVCNDLFFHLQHALATRPGCAGIRGGFVHVPPESALEVEATSRALTQMVVAAREAAQDLRVSAGRED